MGVRVRLLKGKEGEVLVDWLRYVWFGAVMEKGGAQCSYHSFLTMGFLQAAASTPVVLRRSPRATAQERRFCFPTMVMGGESVEWWLCRGRSGLGKVSKTDDLSSAGEFATRDLQ